MTEREQDLTPEQIFEQANAVNAMHPGISVQRDETGALIVFVSPNDETYDVDRYIRLHPIWMTAEQRDPDLAFQVYDDETGFPTTALLARYDGKRYRSVERIEGAEIDATEVVEAAKNAVELFDAFSELPYQARTYVIARKIYDTMRSPDDMRDVLVQAGARGLLALLDEGGHQTLGPGQYLDLFRRALNDLAPPKRRRHIPWPRFISSLLPKQTS